jgi:hypothetical protein
MNCVAQCTSNCTRHCTAQCSRDCSRHFTGERSRHCSVQCSTQFTGHCTLQCVLHCSGKGHRVGGLRIIPPMAELWFPSWRTLPVVAQQFAALVPVSCQFRRISPHCRSRRHRVSHVFRVQGSWGGNPPSTRCWTCAWSRAGARFRHPSAPRPRVPFHVPLRDRPKGQGKVRPKVRLKVRAKVRAGVRAKVRVGLRAKARAKARPRARVMARVTSRVMPPLLHRARHRSTSGVLTGQRPRPSA